MSVSRKAQGEKKPAGGDSSIKRQVSVISPKLKWKRIATTTPSIENPKQCNEHETFRKTG